MRRSLLSGVSALLLAGWIGAAPAQGPPPGAAPQPLIVRLPPQPPASLRALQPLSAAQLGRFREAQQLHAAGLLDRSRAVLLALDREVPHHPLVLTELAQVLLDRQDFGAVERLGRTERTAARDSLLLGHELSLALERLGRPRDAAQVAIEVWAVAPAEVGWASATVVRLAAADARGVREAIRRAAEKLPERPDLARGWARTEWTAGDLGAALRALAHGDRGRSRPSARLMFADEVLGTGQPADTTAAIEALTALAGDAEHEIGERLAGARRAWELTERAGEEAARAPRLWQALRDVPAGQWEPGLLVGVARALRQSGRTSEARALLAARGEEPALRSTVALERALADLRDGPPARALPALSEISAASDEARFRYAEALFFAGDCDSALKVYSLVALNPRGLFAGTALERIYLLEDGSSPAALPVFGKIHYELWRGNGGGAAGLMDSLFRVLPRGPLWAHAAVMLAERREISGNARDALEPLLAVADSLPGDRLAPLARQRAGDLYLIHLKDEAKALAQYEECLARYPRAWNAAEVRRRLEQLRRDRRF